jgi:hypothetical protein
VYGIFENNPLPPPPGWGKNMKKRKLQEEPLINRRNIKISKRVKDLVYAMDGG